MFCNFTIICKQCLSEKMVSAHLSVKDISNGKKPMFCSRDCYYDYIRKVGKSHPRWSDEAVEKRISNRLANGYMPKDFIPWNKGKKMSALFCANIGLRTKGIPLSKEHKASIGRANKGKNTWARGSIRPDWVREKIKQHHSKHWLGKKLPYDVWNKGKAYEQIKGANHWNWKGGVTLLNERIGQRIRHSVEYKIWRRAVLERDGHTCIWGGKEHGNKLHVDHIKPFSMYPELRFAIDNGRTLCVDCHKKTDTYGNSIFKFIRIDIEKGEKHELAI